MSYSSQIEGYPLSPSHPSNPYFILPYHDVTLISSYNLALDQKIEWQKNQMKQEKVVMPKGRGGNNISENIKKSILSILKKILEKQVYLQFEEQCINRHKLRSQKQSIIVIYLYLHKFYSQNVIQLTHIADVTALLRKKITQYIENSRVKMEAEDRNEFHLRNIEEFTKIMRLNLDFTIKRDFAQVVNEVKPFYLRKTREFQKAVQRLQNVIQSDPYFSQLLGRQTSQAWIKQEQERTQDSTSESI